MTMLSVRREVGEFRKRYKWMALCVLPTQPNLALLKNSPITSYSMLPLSRFACHGSRPMFVMRLTPGAAGSVAKPVACSSELT